MGKAQLVVIEDLAPNKMTAAEAIAELRRLLNKNRAASMYNRLADDHKRVVCFAAEIYELEIQDRFEQYSQLQRAAIHRAIKRYSPVFNQLSRFSLTEFNK
jgi:hypothetical protein